MCLLPQVLLTLTLTLVLAVALALALALARSLALTLTLTLTLTRTSRGKAHRACLRLPTCVSMCSTPRSMRTGRQWRPVKEWNVVNKRDGEVNADKEGGGEVFAVAHLLDIRWRTANKVGKSPLSLPLPLLPLPLPLTLTLTLSRPWRSR